MSTEKKALSLKTLQDPSLLDLHGFLASLLPPPALSKPSLEALLFFHFTSLGAEQLFGLFLGIFTYIPESLPLSIVCIPTFLYDTEMLEKVKQAEYVFDFWEMHLCQNSNREYHH